MVALVPNDPAPARLAKALSDAESVLVPLHGRPLFPMVPGFVQVHDRGVAEALDREWKAVAKRCVKKKKRSDGDDDVVRTTFPFLFF